MEKLQDNLLVPKQVNIALECLKAWKKYAKFRKNKALHENEIVLLREDNMRRKYFQDWFNAAMKRAPMTLACVKI